MSFTGPPIITLVADGLVRLSDNPDGEITFGLLSGDSGTISLFENVAGEVILPAAFRPRDYDRSTTAAVVALQDSVQVEITPTSSDTTAQPIRVVKTGTTPANFLITLTNDNPGESQTLLECYIRFH